MGADPSPSSSLYISLVIFDKQLFDLKKGQCPETCSHCFSSFFPLHSWPQRPQTSPHAWCCPELVDLPGCLSLADSLQVAVPSWCPNCRPSALVSLAYYHHMHRNQSAFSDPLGFNAVPSWDLLIVAIPSARLASSTSRSFLVIYVATTPRYLHSYAVVHYFHWLATPWLLNAFIFTFFISHWINTFTYARLSCINLPWHSTFFFPIFGSFLW